MLLEGEKKKQEDLEKIKKRKKERKKSCFMDFFLSQISYIS